MQYSNYKTDYGAPVPPDPTLPGNTGVQQTQPQSQYGQPIAGQPQVLVVPPPILITDEHFKPYETKCPHCHARITTETKFVMGYMANICVITLLCSFIWVGLFCFAFIPCCTDSLKDVQHSCPHCRRVVAEYQRHRIAPQYQSPWLRSRGYTMAHAGLYGGYGQNQQPVPEAPPGILIVQPKPPVTEQHFRPYPTTCPHCRAQITTETNFHVGTFVWYWVFILTCIFVWFGLVCFICIPCCINRCKDVKHKCPRCQKTVAEYLRHEMIY